MMPSSRTACLHASGALLMLATLGACGATETTEARAAERSPGLSGAASAAAEKVAFPNSAVHDLPAPSGRAYQVWVDLPASYHASSKPLPVVFVTDPNFSFAVTRTIRDFTGQRGRNIEDFILVGLTHDSKVSPGDSRARDYTPSRPRRGSNGHSYSAAAYGEAEAYRDYVERLVFPLIAKRYRADMNRKTFVGHSYGSLFGFYTLFSRPGMFQNYILGSPSLWFDEGVIGRLEEAHAAKGRSLRANLLMVAGSYEQPGPTPRHYERVDLVGDMQRFEALLKSRGYAGLNVRSEVAEGEDHFTVFHDVASRGLISLLPGRGPYTSG